MRIREPVNGFTHLAGALLGVVGLVWLLVMTQGRPERFISAAIYGLSLVLLYAASAAYHMVDTSRRVTRILRRVDHAAIYVLIAGTYTPFVALALNGLWQWGWLALVWGIALAGVIIKLFFFRDRNLVSNATYIGYGWLGALFMEQTAHILPRVSVELLASGGVAYTVGALLSAWKKPNLHRHFGAHELWHVMVLCGSAFHFAAVSAFIR